MIMSYNYNFCILDSHSADDVTEFFTPILCKNPEIIAKAKNGKLDSNDLFLLSYRMISGLECGYTTHLAWSLKPFKVKTANDVFSYFLNHCNYLNCEYPVLISDSIEYSNQCFDPYTLAEKYNDDGDIDEDNNIITNPDPNSINENICFSNDIFQDFDEQLYIRLYFDGTKPDEWTIELNNIHFAQVKYGVYYLLFLYIDS